MTSKIFVPSKTKCKLIGTIKDNNLQETCNIIKVLQTLPKHPSTPSALQNTDPRMTIQNITGHKPTKLYGQTSLRKRLIAFFY